jgi:hypothetical protein
MKVPKKEWLCFPTQTPKLVPKVHIVIATPIETLKERPSYTQPIPFPSTMRIYIIDRSTCRAKGGGGEE